MAATVAEWLVRRRWSALSDGLKVGVNVRRKKHAVLSHRVKDSGSDFKFFTSDWQGDSQSGRATLSHCTNMALEYDIYPR